MLLGLARPGRSRYTFPEGNIVNGLEAKPEGEIHMIRVLIRTLFLFWLCLSSLPAQGLEVSKLAGMKARSIGPAGMSGRTPAIAVDPGNDDTIYIGAAAGGVWKSANGGITWTPIFDGQPVASVGAIAVDPTSPDVVWVGTGEGNPRNSISVGNGVYKTRDGGVTWQHLGLEHSEHIHRILIHPRNPEVAYVAALGKLWSAHPQRGVFKTEDGGKSWRKILFVNDRTGAADLVMDPRNPDKLIAALWEHRRSPWDFHSGGPGSGIYLTFDGGESWNRRTDKAGLPAGDLGRIGLAIAENRPSVVYALVEAAKSALLRSEDGGLTWKTVNDSRNINPRPFYYADIYVDPNNENRIYSLHSRLTVSEDGGKSVESVVESSRIHGDHHALWINPANSLHLIDSNDGGVAITRDGGATWRFVENLPLAQFYHVAIDMETPYNVYGGLQDNGSWRGPSSIWNTRGIYNWYWQRVGSGDGFDTIPDPTNPGRYGYAMSQGGNLQRFDLATGERKPIQPVHPDGVRLRFNWNAGIASDPFEPATIYYGSQFLHRSRDRGESWEIISPDLTSNNPEWQQQLDSGGLTYDVTGAENFTTILVIAPSPVEPGVIWVGTDDGNLQLTRDGGANWSNVAANIRGVPENTWIPHLKASSYSGSEAFVVFDDHRRGNWETYAFHTDDYGKSWRRLDSSGATGYALAIEQDPVEPRLLFLGTEFGLFFSIDAGRSWHRWSSGFPTTSAMDLIVHPRDHDLVVGTHGRGVFILDDIRPLRELAQGDGSLLNTGLHLFDVGDAIQYVRAEPPGLRGPGDAVFQGENRPYGALITFVANSPEAEIEAAEPAPDAPDEEAEEGDEPSGSGSAKPGGATIEILDGDGQVIRTLQHSPRPGVNRAFWQLDRRGYRLSSFGGGSSRGEPGGYPVLPGEYTVRVRYQGQEASRTVRVLPDPRAGWTDEGTQAKQQLFVQMETLQRDAVRTVERLRKAEQNLKDASSRLDAKDHAQLKQQAEQLGKAIEQLQEQFRGRQVQGIRRDPETVQSKILSAAFSLSSTWSPPTEAQQLRCQLAQQAFEAFSAAIEESLAAPWAELSAGLKEAGLGLLPGM